MVGETEMRFIFFLWFVEEYSIRKYIYTYTGIFTLFNSYIVGYRQRLGHTVTTVSQKKEGCHQILDVAVSQFCNNTYNFTLYLEH